MFKMAGVMKLLIFVSFAAIVIGQKDIPEDCGPCDQSKCVAPGNCPAGTTLDRCKCCDTCSKGLSELCDHPEAHARKDVQYGTCGKNLECRLREDIPAGEEPEAICFCIQDEPVCGNDGNTYDNICQLKAAKNMGKSDLEKKKTGACISAPKVVSGPVNVRNKTGSDITLSCEVSGFPIPTIEWMWRQADGHVIQLPNDDFQLSVSARGGPEKFQVTGFLQIEDLQKRHEGDYTCVANNKVDSDKASARVKVIKDEVQTNNNKKLQKKKSKKGGNDL